jgi:hypothetical protein
MGNILELCAFELYPDPKIALGFTMCLTRDYKSIPQRELVEACALEHAIDMKDLNDCASRDNGAHGTDLLVASVQRTIAVGDTLLHIPSLGSRKQSGFHTLCPCDLSPTLAVFGLGEDCLISPC